MSEDTVIKKILCAVDFSEYSKKTLMEAVYLAEKLGATLVILNVINQRTYDDIERMLGRFQQLGGMGKALEEAVTNTENERVEKMKSLLAEVDAGRAPHTSRVSVGVPYEKILELSEKEKVDLIVLGAHGRGSIIKQLRFGSNAEKIFRRAKCRVLFIR